MKRGREAALTWGALVDSHNSMESLIQTCKARSLDELQQCKHGQYLVQVLVERRASEDDLMMAIRAGMRIHMVYDEHAKISILEYAAKQYLPAFVVLAREMARQCVHDKIVFVAFMRYVRMLIPPEIDADLFMRGLYEQVGVFYPECAQLDRLETLAATDVIEFLHLAKFLFAPHIHKGISFYLLFYINCLLVKNGLPEVDQVLQAFLRDCQSSSSSSPSAAASN